MTTTKNTHAQQDTYRIFDSMGRRTEIVICASNINEACQIAKSREKEIGSKYYKVKRVYEYGMRAQDLRF